MPCSKKETTWKKDTCLLRGIIVHAWRVMAQFFWASDDFESWRRRDVLHRRHGGLIVPHHLVARKNGLGIAIQHHPNMLKAEKKTEMHVVEGNKHWMLSFEWLTFHILENTKTNGNLEKETLSIHSDELYTCTIMFNEPWKFGNAICTHIVAWVHLSWCLNCQFIVDHVHLPTPRSEWCWLHWHVLLQVYPIPPEENSTWKTTAKT